MITADGKELSLFRGVLKAIEQSTRLPIGKYCVEQRGSPARDSFRDPRRSLVVNFSCVLNGVDLEVPLQVSLRFVIDRSKLEFTQISALAEQ